MHHCNGKMRFFCHLLVVSFVIEAVIAAANTTASSISDAANTNEFESDTKNKRQVNQYIRTPGTSAVGTESGPQIFPLQLSHNIYQQRLPLYTRRPTTDSKQQEDNNEQGPQQHQQQQQSILPSYYNFVPNIGSDSSDSVHIDSRHLPVEPRTKVQTYQSTPPQRLQIGYSSVAPKQSTSSQSLISEDEYLELIRNTDLVKSSQGINSKIPFGYVTATPTTSVDSGAYVYSTESQLKNNKNNNDYRKFTSRNHLLSTPTSPVNLQPQNSQQQFVRQPSQYTAVTPSQEFETSYDKDTVRINLKKYQESDGKTKYDPTRGQYHQEVSVKPTKKAVNFKPSYQYANMAQSSNNMQIQTQSSSSNRQQSVIQSEPIHYQSVDQIIRTEITKANQAKVVPQSQVYTQQAYFPAEINQPFQSYVPHHERLVTNNYGQVGFDQKNPPSIPQHIDNKPKGQSEFRIQYVHHVSQTPTPTPTPTTPRFVTDITSQPLKYELFDPSGNINGAREVPPKIKLVPAPWNDGTPQRPQYVDQPQYYKKIKIQPAAHVHYVPVRTKYHQPTQQPVQVQSSQSAQSPQSDPLISIQPARSALFVAQSTGHSESVSPSATGSVEKLPQSIPAGHQTLSDPRKPPLPITSPKKPISQAEFQALLDAGYKVQAIPVPVPVSIDKYKQLQYQQQQRQQHHTQPVHSPVVLHHHANEPAQHTRQANTHYIRYHPKQESEEGILTSYLKPLIDYIGGPSQ